ncbi:hypothetical protein PJL18_03780 [Paenarthrobacter nicotinovorans]|nr:hypothetical protein [Paenarthrobacter nicotinovorans]
MGACRNVGTATLTASRPSSSIMSSQRANAWGMLYSSFSWARRSASMPATATISTPSMLLYALRCCWPAQPMPTTPTLRVVDGACC